MSENDLIKDAYSGAFAFDNCDSVNQVFCMNMPEPEEVLIAEYS